MQMSKTIHNCHIHVLYSLHILEEKLTDFIFKLNFQIYTPYTALLGCKDANIGTLRFFKCKSPAQEVAYQQGHTPPN